MRENRADHEAERDIMGADSDAQHMNKAQTAFLNYNQARIERSLQISPKNAGIALHLVPILLHHNDPALPGYVESDIKYTGMASFEITDEMRNATSRYARDFKLPENTGFGGGMGMGRRDYNDYGGGGGMRQAPFLEALFLMGSVGAAAQNSKSDFDYWAMVDKSVLSEEQLNLLQQKLLLIEEWGDKQGAELHFFITDLKAAQDNNFGTADKESAGSSQARLLKEEFYRTMVYVCGKYPVWWLTQPAINDEQYAKALEILRNAFGVDHNRYIDLGNIHTITEGEFFGAALWQINKAMDSPFKSVLKMALLESFIDPKGKSLLLCDQLKKNVLTPDAPARSLDPYLVMIDRLLWYYGQKKRDDVVDLIRKCLYNKVNVKLTYRTKNKTNISFKEQMMLQYTQEWKWDDQIIESLNNYEDWDFGSMMELGNKLHGFMLETYKNLTDQLKGKQDGSSTMISDEDLTILGRKLFSFYKKAPAKVELVKRASDAGIRQETCTFMPTIIRGKKPIWEIYRDNITTEVARKANVEQKLIKKSTSLAELVTWAAVNKIIHGGTFMYLIPNTLPISLKDIQSLVKSINEFMPYQPISTLKNEALLHSPSLTHLLLVVNYLSNPATKTLDEITLIYRNTHGETFSETHPGKEAINKIAACLSKEMTPVIKNPKDFFHIFIPRAENSAKLEKLLSQMIFGQLEKRGVSNS